MAQINIVPRKILNNKGFIRGGITAVGLIIFALIFAAVGSYIIFFSHASSLTGDINNDGTVNVFDLSLLLSSYGQATTTCSTAPSDTCDLNADGHVNVFDLSILLSNWGQTVTADCTDPYWPAPTLSSPITLNIPTSGGGPSNDGEYELDNQKDYNIVLPSGTRTGSLKIDGGRNITVIGGSGNHTMVNGTDAIDAMLYFVDAWGTDGSVVSGRIIHMAHLSINLTGGIQRDGIAFDTPSAIAQIEDVHVIGGHGSSVGSGVHVDIVQPYSSMQQVRIDRLTGDSDYQGLTFISTDAAINAVTLRRINLTLDPSSTDTYSQILYLVGRDNTTSPISFYQVYVNNTRSGQTAQQAVYPDGSASPPTVFSSNQISFPGWPNLSGVVTGGNPPGGNFSCQ